ncbi:molybdenum cofactor guanylyltransferase [Paucibacter sediminis]|uniref:Molybdenum cofactor guanylyltransferase n=1 Tax=Paucibacter sediminis TaxID=3019553 RepID=A0AA95NGG7_9BURK|nr:molybdenum cofactor guanylyltransferase MobA [Paucibacter sp. S2-9]WIT10411.1 molybdenum cofactor guanylyltransferase [Paucibacter sp. S2-9]
MNSSSAADITGLLLCGGRGSRMGGVDKGLQPLQGRPLVEHVLERLGPQVGTLLINANRNLARYGAYGHAVLADASADYAGPLAGLLAGLQACRTRWLLAVPCDAPRLPLDLAARLLRAAEREGAAVALPVTERVQPVFCLLRQDLAPGLSAYLAGGGHRVEACLRAQPHVLVPFDRDGDAAAFFNANSLDELQRLAAD